ncbi:hypothetical protein [Xanthobacter sp. NM-25]|nr:hypothetical protein [Xanthobacter sp. NM-25]
MTAITAILIVVALVWMMRVEARLRELFDRLERQRPAERSQEPVKFF